MARPRKHAPGHGPTAAERLRQSLAALEARGGRVVQLRLEAEDLALVAALQQRQELATVSDAIRAALRIAAAHHGIGSALPPAP